MDLLRELEIDETTWQKFTKKQTEGYVKAFSWRILKKTEVDVEEGRSTKRWIVADLIILTEEKILLFYIVRGWKGIVKTSATEGWYVESADHVKEAKPSPVIEAQNRRDLLERNLKAAGLQQEDLKDRLFDYVLFDLHEGSVSRSVTEKHDNVLTREGFQSFLDENIPSKSWFSWLRSICWKRDSMTKEQFGKVIETISGTSKLDVLKMQNDDMIPGQMMHITVGGSQGKKVYERQNYKEIKFSPSSHGFVRVTPTSRSTQTLGWQFCSFVGFFNHSSNFDLPPGSTVQFEVLRSNGEFSRKIFSPSDLELIKLNQ